RASARPGRSACRSAWTNRSPISRSGPGWTGPSTWNSTAWRWCVPSAAAGPEAPHDGKPGARSALARSGVRRGLGRRRGRCRRLGLALGGRVGLGRAVAGEVALPVAFLLEVGLVPATACEAERRRGHLPLDRSGLTGGTDRRVGIRQLLQLV